MQLPWLLMVGFSVILLTQILFHRVALEQASINYKPLSTPFDASVYRGLSMGSEQLFSYLLAIRLQLHDNQAGRHIRYSQIDYELLVSWLDQIYRLNTASEYPISLASRVYSQTRDKAQLRIILDFIERTYEVAPQLHWRHLADSTVIAKYRLEDLPLALELAQKLSGQPESVKMPAWARDIEFLLLGDLNEYESALAIVAALLKSNAVDDPDEKIFLEEKLLYFQQKLLEKEHSSE